jgi:hypothetical protein
MENTFEISVDFKGQTRIYRGELRPYGYTYKIVIGVNNTEVSFEPDEERNFRALVPPDLPPSAIPETGLLEAIATALEESLKD